MDDQLRKLQLRAKQTGAYQDRLNYEMAQLRIGVWQTPRQRFLRDLDEIEAQLDLPEVRNLVQPEQTRVVPEDLFQLQEQPFLFNRDRTAVTNQATILISGEPALTITLGYPTRKGVQAGAITEFFEIEIYEGPLQHSAMSSLLYNYLGAYLTSLGKKRKSLQDFRNECGLFGPLTCSRCGADIYWSDTGPWGAAFAGQQLSKVLYDDVSDHSLALNIVGVIHRVHTPPQTFIYCNECR